MSRPCTSGRGVVLVGLALIVGACSRSPDPAQRYASRYKALTTAWAREIQTVSGSFDARLAAVPKRERRAFLLAEMRDEGEIHVRTLENLKALGTPPPEARELVAVSTEVLTFLSRSSRARAEAAERRDKAASARVDAEFDAEVRRLGARLIEARNAAARDAGLAEMSEVDLLAGAER